MYQSAGPTAHTYVIPEPYERALKLVRATLAKEGLGIPVELDISLRIRKELGVALAPCKVLCVDSPMVWVQTMAIDTSGAIFLPLHLVVSARGPATFVHLAGPAAIPNVGVPPAARIPITKFQARLSRILQRIAGRQALAS